MIYNVSQLMKANVGSVQTDEIYGEAPLPLDERDIHQVGPTRGHVKMTRTNQGILADGTAELDIQLTCARCLKEFVQHFTIKFVEQFYPTIDVITGYPLPPIEDETIFPIDENHHIDLTEALRQNVLVALPISPLCREDCAGLCPQCGHDLNLGPCSCKPTVEDNRWDVLKQILPQEPTSVGNEEDK